MQGVIPHLNELLSEDDDDSDFREKTEISIDELICIDQNNGKFISPTQKLMNLLKMTPRFSDVDIESPDDFFKEIMKLGSHDLIQC